NFSKKHSRFQMTSKASSDPFYQKLEPLFTRYLSEGFKEKETTPCPIEKVVLKPSSTGDVRCVIHLDKEGREKAHRYLPQGSMKILREQMANNRDSCLEEHIQGIA